MRHTTLPSRVLAAFLAPACAFLLAACGGGGGGQSAPPIHAEQWANAYGGTGSDSATSVQPTADGGYIVAGYTQSFGAGDYDAWLLKLDASGNVVWQKTYGAANTDQAYYVQQTSNGGYIVAGETADDAWILKLDAGGNVIWQKAYGAAGRDSAAAVQETPDGGYIVSGSLGTLATGDSDAWVFKLDSSGNVAWQKTYGGTRDDNAYYVQPTADHGYIVAGDTDYDAWILKLDADGNVIWQRTFGGAGSDHAYSVQPTVDGGYIVAGSLTTYPSGNGQAWVLKLDADGSILWQRTYGGASEQARSVQPTADGGYIVTATTRVFALGPGPPPSLLLKLDAQGNVMWQRAYGFFSGAVQTTPDGGYVVAGSQWGGSFPPHPGSPGHTSAFVAKLGATGEITDCAFAATIASGAADGDAMTGIPTRTIAASNATTTNTTIVPGNSAAVPLQECP